MNVSDIDRWTRARVVFDAVVALAPAEREHALGERCGDDAVLLDAVRSLLRTHDAMPDTIDDHLGRRIGESIGRLWPTVKPGQRFGAFAIVEEIARGGMGAVFLAERNDGAVRQRVALKIVGLPGVDAESSLRLARERRLLASLEHPNIARLIDAGEDAAGVPYFAMEYVGGAPITRYCDEHKLGLEQRLHLFRQVCSAVQYAHANLVVHCDLKPSNILATENGLPKLLDFGIAASLDADSSNERRVASGERWFFSPHAAAPEQFLGEAGSIAVDVYALGVLLCELMSGGRPFDFTGLDPEQIRHRVLHDSPALPSACVTESAAHARGISARTLRRRLRGDIDAIVDKALRKQPSQRYTSVEHLDADIAAHLALRPIAARASQRRYVIGRFVRRNAIAVSAGVLLAAVLIAFAGVTSVQNKRLAAERDEAQRREQQARFERARAEQVTDFLIGLFRAADPAQARGHDVTARELLARGDAHLRSDLPDQAALRAAMLSAISDIYLALDDLDGAQRTADAAAQLRAQDIADVAAHVASLRQLANLATRRGKPSDALALVDRALALSDAMPADRLMLLETKAAALEGLSKLNDAIALRREALTLATQTYGESDARTVKVAVHLARSLRTAGMPEESARLLDENLPRERAGLSGDDPEFGGTLLDLAMYARSKGDFAKAEPLAREALELFTRVYGSDASQTASAANTLATCGP